MLPWTDAGRPQSRVEADPVHPLPCTGADRQPTPSAGPISDPDLRHFAPPPAAWPLSPGRKAGPDDQGRAEPAGPRAAPARGAPRRRGRRRRRPGRPGAGRAPGGSGPGRLRPGPGCAKTAGAAKAKARPARDFYVVIRSNGYLFVCTSSSNVK